MYRIIVISTIFHVCLSYYIDPVDEEPLSESVESLNRVNFTLHRTVKKYYCAATELDDSYLLIYGSKGWTFPVQNVNITLSYPTGPMRQRYVEPWETFVIIGFKVNLYLDGSDTTGYISGGGIFNDTISLTFLCNDITTLSYQFWLYGIPKSLHTKAPVSNNNHFVMC